jgi:hypothetical protein
MLDVNLEPLFSKFVDSLAKLHPSGLGLVRCWVKLCKIVQVHSLRYAFDHPCMREEIPRRLFALARDLLEEGLTRIRESTCKETLSIGRALDLYLCEKDPALSFNYFTMIYSALGCGKHDRFKE